jgi:glucose/arabinose dehydrogenase
LRRAALTFAWFAVVISLTFGFFVYRAFYRPDSTPHAVTPPGNNASAAPGAAGATSSPASPPLPEVRLERAFPRLAFDHMTGMYPSPDGRMFVLEQRGRVLVFDASADPAQAEVFLDIRDRVDSSSTEMGLLGFALAPDFVRSGKFYVDYSTGNPRRTVIARFTATSPAQGLVNPSSEEPLLEIGQPFVNHKGGQILFGPDGMLYIGMGDGGSAYDPMGNGQNLGVLLGKVLRLDVSRAGPGAPYAVPADNPFAGQAGARAEVWAYGLRNPWRFSIDPATGAMWAGDVGQNSWEEVDLIAKGGNYGWGILEADHCAHGDNCDRSGKTAPVVEYATGKNCSVTGGFIYRGRAIPTLAGAYVYGDYCSGKIWAFRYDSGRVTELDEMVASGFQISSFAVDNAGEIYALSHADAGGVFKIVPK